MLPKLTVSIRHNSMKYTICLLIIIHANFRLKQQLNFMIIILFSLKKIMIINFFFSLRNYDFFSSKKLLIFSL